jgi:hypothetical protein
MLLINKISPAGGIKRLELTPDTVQAKLHNGRVITYRLVSDCGPRDNVKESDNGSKHEAVQM